MQRDSFRTHFFLNKVTNWMIIYLKLQNRLQNASWMGMVCPTAYLLLHAKDPFLIFCHDAPVRGASSAHHLMADMHLEIGALSDASPPLELPDAPSKACSPHLAMKL